MHDQVKSFIYLFSFWDLIILFTCIIISQSQFFFCCFSKCFSAHSPAVMVFQHSLCTVYSHPLPYPTLSSPHLLPPGWKAILVVDWRMMLLLRESLHQHRGMRGERKEREKSSGGVVAPWGAVAVMGELSNAPLSKLPSKHHVTTRD